MSRTQWILAAVLVGAILAACYTLFTAFDTNASPNFAPPAREQSVEVYLPPTVEGEVILLNIAPAMREAYPSIAG